MTVIHIKTTMDVSDNIISDLMKVVAIQDKNKWLEIINRGYDGN
jgi:hypothetical protein